MRRSRHDEPVLITTAPENADDEYDQVLRLDRFRQSPPPHDAVQHSSSSLFSSGSRLPRPEAESRGATKSL